jgi:large conductance mechanosensitive channel
MDPIDRITSSGPARRAASFYEQFKQFAFRGNVIDLAVGVVIGTAFAKIVDSLVKNILMPLLASVTPDQGGYVQWKEVVNGSEIKYGEFLGEVVNFLFVAAALFVFVRVFLNWLIRAKEKEGPPPLTKDQELLTEIRDLLRKQAG